MLLSDNMIFLSICIPTYNRSTYLKENVESIIAQIIPDLSNHIEICISNNGSTDDTDQVVREIIHANPLIKIKYNVGDVNRGADWNFNNSMNMASGKYSWLLGDDDGLAKNGLKRITEILIENPTIGIFVFNRINCDIKLNEVSTQKFLREDIKAHVADFSNHIEEKYYYSLCRSLGGLLSFISAVVYDTRAVKEQQFDEAFIGSAYSFLYYWFSFLKKGNKLMYLDEYLIKCRHGLPSWGSGYKRTMLDFNGFFFVKSKLFTDETGHEFLGVLKYEWPLQDLLAIYCRISTDEWNNEVRPLLKIVGWSEREIIFVETIGDTPNLYDSKFKLKLKKLLRRN